MSNLHRLNISDIILGEGIPWNIMDSFGRLLLKRGAVINTRAHALEMIERGMFIEEELYTKLPQLDSNSKTTTTRNSVETPAILKNEFPSVIYSLNLAVQRLGILLRSIKKFPNAREKFLEIVKIIQYGIHLNENLALANIQLNHVSGDYPVRHCVDTAILAILVAESMSKTEQEIQDIAAAAISMNISMIELQEKLQGNKAEISEADKIAIHNHPIASIDMLYDAGIEDTEWLKYVMLHHEHEDGSGYPIGNVTSEIPQNAKILSLADGFCARISARGYRRSNLPNVALRDIFIDNRAHADATLAAYFIKVLGLYPPGTFVMLKNKETAVISQRATDKTPCIASALVKANGELYVNPAKRETSVEPFTIMEAIYPTKAAVYVNLQQIWGSLAST